MPTSPCPLPGAVAACSPADPFTTLTINSPPTRRTCTSTTVPRACRTALLTASCTTRYAVSSTAGSSPVRGSTSSRTSAPARRVPATSSARSPSAGCGPSWALGPSPGSSRSNRSTRLISVSEDRASSAIPANSSRASSGSPVNRCGALSARTTTTDKWCATTSCSSRAIRARSCNRARCVRSAALMPSCSTSCCRASVRDLSRSATTTATAENTAMVNRPGHDPRSGATVMPATPTSWVASHHPANSRREAPRAPTIARTTECPKTPVTGHGHGSPGETGTQTAAVTAEVANETGKAPAGLNQTSARPRARAAPNASAAPSGNR